MEELGRLCVAERDAQFKLQPEQVQPKRVPSSTRNPELSKNNDQWLSWQVTRDISLRPLCIDRRRLQVCGNLAWGMKVSYNITSVEAVHLMRSYEHWVGQQGVLHFSGEVPENYRLGMRRNGSIYDPMRVLANTYTRRMPSAALAAKFQPAPLLCLAKISLQLQEY